MARSSNNNNGQISAAFQEVSANTPKVVSSTLRKYGPDRARKQKIAIALSKARKAGAKIPSSGGMKSYSNKAY